MSISEKLKKKLVQLGVPADRHDAASLAALFPGEFKISDASLTAAEIANVFLTFVEHGLITAPRAQARPLQSHVCHFYHSDAEALSMCAAFLNEGLAAGQRCLWVPPSWIPVERARAALRAVRPSVDEAEAAGRLLFFTDDQVHLDGAGAMRDAGGIIRFWLEQEQEALARSFRGLRIAGDGTVLVSSAGWKTGVDYERRCDEAFRGRKILALCQYGVKDVPAARLAEVLSGHGVGVARAAGAWRDLHPGVGASAAFRLLKPR